MQISAILLKNSAGTQILFTHMFVASASNGVGDLSVNLFIINSVIKNKIVLATKLSTCKDWLLVPLGKPVKFG
jgi:hypothetical protein